MHNFLFIYKMLSYKFYVQQLRFSINCIFDCFVDTNLFLIPNFLKYLNQSKCEDSKVLLFFIYNLKLFRLFRFIIIMTDYRRLFFLLFFYAIMGFIEVLQ